MAKNQWIKYPLFMFLPFYLALYSACFSLDIQAGPFADALAPNPEKESYWKSIIREVNEIEQYQLRNLELKADAIDPIRTVLSQHSITDVSRALESEIGVTSIAHWTPQQLDNAKNMMRYINENLKFLPEISLTAYTHLSLPKRVWQHFEPGALLHETGILRGSVSLAVIQQRLDEVPYYEEYDHVVIRIRSKTGRLVEHLYQNQEGDMLWPKNRIFRCLKKDVSDHGHIKYLDVEEIAWPEAKSHMFTLNTAGFYTRRCRR